MPKEDGLSAWRLDSEQGFYIFAAFLVAFPIFSQDPYILNIFIISLTFSILAVSWNFICGYTGIFTFGHQAFFGLGAYVSALLSMKLNVSPWLGLILGGITSGAISFLIGLPCLRLRAAPYIAIMTLAFSEILRITCMNMVNITRGEMGLWGIPNFSDITVGSYTISFSGADRLPYYYLILLVFILLMMALAAVLKSPVGLAFKSIRDSQEAAESLGINVTFYKLVAFVSSAFFAGVIGSFYAHYILILTPTSLFNLGIMVEIMAMTLMGGLGSFLGPVLVAFGLTVGLEYLRFLGDYRFITYGILLIMVVLFMPQGLGKNIFKDREIAN
jgi:branched-chain amino acid transport system permease protein